MQGAVVKETDLCPAARSHEARKTRLGSPAPRGNENTKRRRGPACPALRAVFAGLVGLRFADCLGSRAAGNQDADCNRKPPVNHSSGVTWSPYSLRLKGHEWHR